jgi:hypothetical protein
VNSLNNNNKIATPPRAAAAASTPSNVDAIYAPICCLAT